MPLKSLRFLVALAIILALFVVVLGAFTRLTNAGLGCPDWPGCYGHMVLPTAKVELSHAQRQYPHIPIETRKAWTEMAHRYAAGTLAFLILVIGCSALRLRLADKYFPWHLPLLLMVLVLFQAALGMWTVTLKLLPAVVMGHLLGGMTIFATLCYFRMQLNHVAVKHCPTSSEPLNINSPAITKWRPWVGLGVVLVFCQIALGGWVSSNYAGVACIGFPRCNGLWVPPLHLYQGFNLFSPVGANYQGGVLDHDVRMTIQFIHRVGALIVASYVLILASLIRLGRNTTKCLRTIAISAMVLVLLQFILGIANVVYLLPLWVAVMHNGVAALLLATMLMMRYFVTGGATHVQ